MKRLRMLLAPGLLASALITGPGCDKEPTAPTVPTIIATPTPDPKTDPTSCVQTNAKLHGGEVQGFQDVELVLVPYNEANVPLTDSCRYAQTVGWNYAGPCLQLGDRTSLIFRATCNETGYLDVVATHGQFKAVARVRLVR